MTPLGVLIAVLFIVGLAGTLGWMLRVPPPAPRGATTAVRSVSALRKIVVPVIDLGASVRAVELAARLNEGRTGQMLIVYVHEIPLQAPLVMPERDPTIERALNLAAFIATQHGLTPQTKVAVARQVGHRIVEIAREEAADLIVIGVTLKNRPNEGPLGRIAGPAWILLALMGYLVYRRLQGLSPLGSQTHDWEAAQKRVLQEAEEFESLEEYEAALAERDGPAGRP